MLMRFWRKKNLHSLFMGMQTSISTLKIRKKKNPNDKSTPNYTILGLCLKNVTSYSNVQICTLFSIAKKGKQSKH